MYNQEFKGRNYRARSSTPLQDEAPDEEEEGEGDREPGEEREEGEEKDGDDNKENEVILICVRDKCLQSNRFFNLLIVNVINVKVLNFAFGRRTFIDKI